jgi:glycerophosphoryl diester phosphodiesterase
MSVHSLTTLASAWQRVLRLWRPMAGWTLLVWFGVAGLLTPISTALLGLQVLRGEPTVVGNEALLAWLTSPRGVVWLLLAGGLGLTGAVVRYAGLFHILTDDLAGRQPTIRRTALHLVPQVPVLFRLALVVVAAGLALAAALLGGLAGIRGLFLAEFDINFYLAERPAEWHRALIAALVWGAAWAALALFVLGRTALAIPAFLDGHQPLRVAFIRARERGRGAKPRLFRLLGLAVAAWLAARFVAPWGYHHVAGAGVEAVVAMSSSLRVLVLATAAYGGGLLVLDAVLAFFGFSFVATVLTKFYYEDTDLHAAAPPGFGLRGAPWRVMRRAGPWLRPRRLGPLLVVAAVGSVVASTLLLERVPEPAPVAVIAHRAGPPPSPENTLAALERSIAAGADYAEIDVQRARDGTVVVVHDADLMRVAGDPRRVRQTPYADMAVLVQRPDDGSPADERRVATLDAFLERARGRIRLAIELKYYGADPGLAPAVLQAIRATGMEQDVVVMSLSLDAVQQLSRLAPDLATGYVAAAAVGDPTQLSVPFLAVSRQLATPRLLRAARARGMAVHVWTVNQAPVMAELMERGVAGIITDDPALAVRVREELLAMPPAARLLLRFGPAPWDATDPTDPTDPAER